jgi:hypothetical protein
MKQFFRSAFFFLILSTLISPRGFGQTSLPHYVLFETFTNNCDPTGSAATQIRNTFDANVNSTVSSENSKILHLDHHFGNECDFLQNAYSFAAAGYVLPPGNVIFWGAVNRTTFGSTGTRGSSDPSDWSSAIDNGYPPPAPDDITLLDATLDKTNAHNYVLHADVQVTLNSSVSDSLVIRYAVVQDQVHDTLNSGSSTTLNDVVRYITNSNSGYTVFPGGGSAGAQKTVSFKVSVLPGPNDPDYFPAFDWTKMRLIAFIEDVSQGNFSVVDAVQLKAGLDSLQPPPPTLVLTESSITGDTLHPGTTPQIFYSSTNLQGGVAAYYSLDNGTTWRFFSNATSSPITWTVPDSLTTQGKIKLVAVNEPSLTSTEVGNFTIAYSPFVQILAPLSGIVLKAKSVDTIRWTKYSVGGVKLQYYIQTSSGGFVTPNKLADNDMDTSFVWTVPDTSAVVEIQVLPDDGVTPAYDAVDTIERTVTVGVAENNAGPSGLSITNIFPNPASNGQEIVVQCTQANPKQVTMQLLDLLGHVVSATYSTDDLSFHLNTSTLMAGAYIVRISDGASTVSKRVEIIR